MSCILEQSLEAGKAPGITVVPMGSWLEGGDRVNSGGDQPGVLHTRLFLFTLR